MVIMDYGLWAGGVRRDDWRREDPSWTIGLEKSSHFGGKKTPGRRTLPPRQTRKTRPAFAGWGGGDHR